MPPTLLPGETVIIKNYPNSFRNTPLLEVLRQAQAGPLVIAGMMTHMCVDATVRAAVDSGFKCILLHDACAMKALTFASEMVPAAQGHASMYARVISADELIAEIPSLRSKK